MKIKLRNDIKTKYVECETEYTVYAMYLDSPIELIIQVDSLPATPYSISLNDVDVIDNRLSKYWVISEAITASNLTQKRPAILSFPEWVNDIYFFENIVESKNNAGDIWRQYKGKMELEFASSNLTKEVIPLSDGWVECENCSNAWQPEQDDEVVICPECSTIQKYIKSRDQNT